MASNRGAGRVYSETVRLVGPPFYRAGSLAVILAAALGVFSCRRSETPPPPAVMRATLIAVQGDVRLKRAAEAEYAPASRGTPLAVADLLQTGAGGHATLLFDDGTTAVMTPRSLVSIEPAAMAGGQGALSIQSGRVDLDIVARGDEQFRVNTPDAQAGVPAREIMVQTGGRP